MRAFTLALRAMTRLILGICAAIGSAVISIGGRSAEAATLGAQAAAGWRSE